MQRDAYTLERPNITDMRNDTAGYLYVETCDIEAFTLNSFIYSFPANTNIFYNFTQI